MHCIGVIVVFDRSRPTFQVSFTFNFIEIRFRVFVDSV